MRVGQIHLGAPPAKPRSTTLPEARPSVPSVGWPRSAGRRVAIVGLMFVITTAATVTIAVANPIWFDIVNSRVGAQDPIARAIVFSSWLLLLGGPLVVRRPSAFGFRLGDTGRHMGLVAGVIAGGALATAVLLTITGSTPYSEASIVVESIVVPFTEELVFRGVMLTLLLVATSRHFDPHRAALIAVAINGVAFGLGHLANIAHVEASFVIGQSVFAAILGAACAGLMVRTRSVYPAMALHAAVNAVVVLT